MITDAIVDLMCNFERDNHKKPKFIYMGYEEYAELINLDGMACFANFRLESAEVCGMKLFLVNADSHLNLSA
jgi:hypothetical protein